MDVVRTYAANLGLGMFVGACSDRDVLAAMRQVLGWSPGMSDADLLGSVRRLATDYGFDLGTVAPDDHERVLSVLQGRPRTGR